MVHSVTCPAAGAAEALEGGSEEQHKNRQVCNFMCTHVSIL